MENFDDIYETEVSQEEPIHTEKPFDKEAFAARKKQEREAVYALADDTASKMAVDGKTFQDYLDVQSRFDRYSVTNAILITAQLPTATKLADFNTWRDSGIYIKKGAEAITILGPGKEYTRDTDGTTGVFYNPKKVFDISQTNIWKKAPTTVHYDTKLLLKALIDHAPCRFAVSQDLPDGVNAVYDREQDTLFARPGLDGDVCFQSVARELAHARMEQSGQTFAAPTFAADCISCMVCKRYGIAVDMFRLDQPPEAYQSMGTREFRDELGKMRDVSGDMIVEMRQTLDNLDKSRRERDSYER